MIYKIPKKYKNQEIRVPIRTSYPERICVKVYHPRRAHTEYFDAAPIIRGEDKFIIKIPNMPDEGVVMEIFNESHGHLNYDNSFSLGKISSHQIRLGFIINKIMDPNVARFMAFSDEFAEKAAILSAQNSVYISADGRFRIDYKDVIRDDKGNELRTPARVHSKTKVIEISRKYYLAYTVPGRRAINLHEFAHVYQNSNPADEFEADKNAIMIYLGTGNPTIEAYNVFCKIFKNSPSDLNVRRYNELNKFIRNFNQIMTKRVGNAA